jgi:prepilin-type N-terminal cleavage/methylation domain-containing protein
MAVNRWHFSACDPKSTYLHMLIDQNGLTLIEIIAVLVLVGILAAVAIPRYIGLQEQAADKVADATLSAAFSALSSGYAANKLGAANNPAGPATACANVQLTGNTITNVNCVGDNWGVSGTNVAVIISYTGGTTGRNPLTANWATP